MKHIRACAVLLAVCLLCAWLPVQALAADAICPDPGSYFCMDCHHTSGDITYSYGEPASGNGWSYDGNYTLTLSGYGPADGAVIYFSSPQQEMTIVLADGTMNKISHLGFVDFYEFPGIRNLTITGGGVLHCETGLSVDRLTVAGGIVHVGYQLECSDGLVLDGGLVTCEALSITVNAAPCLIEDGSLILEDSPRYSTSGLSLRILHPDGITGLEGLVTDSAGRELTEYRVTMIDTTDLSAPPVLTLAQNAARRVYCDADGWPMTSALIQPAGAVSPEPDNPFSDVTTSRYYLRPFCRPAGTTLQPAPPRPPFRPSAPARARRSPHSFSGMQTEHGNAKGRAAFAARP